jgi:hypothetical protein
MELVVIPTPLYWSMDNEYRKVYTKIKIYREYSYILENDSKHPVLCIEYGNIQ